MPQWPLQRNHVYTTKKKELGTGMRSSRSITNGKLIEEGKSERATSSFINDSTRAWNEAPGAIKNCKSLFSAKMAIKSLSIQDSSDGRAGGS